MSDTQNFHIGAKVKYKNNPNPVEVIYDVKDINVYVRDGKLTAYCEMSPDKDYPISEGGYISKNNTSEANVLELDIVK